MKGKKYNLAAFAQEHGLTIEKHGCYGVYKGYRVHVRYRAMGNPACIVTVVTDAKGREKDIERYLEKNKHELHLTQYGVVGIGLMLCPQLYRGVFRHIGEILDKVVRQLAKIGCPGADVCPYCGKPLAEQGAVSMRESGIPFRAHEACYRGAYAAMAERERRERERPDKILFGIGGLMLGVLAGAAVLVLLFLWWNVAAVSTGVAVLLGAWLYGKCGGKSTAGKVVLCAVLPLLLLAGVYVLCLYFEAAQAAEGMGAWQYISERWAAESSYRLGIILNSVFLAVFDLVAAVYVLFTHLRARRSIAAHMHICEE